MFSLQRPKHCYPQSPVLVHKHSHSFVRLLIFRLFKMLNTSAFIGIAPVRKQSGNYEAKGRISKIGNV
ncbi:MAG: transposase [Chromatiales bacterium]|nr:transposase [Chromatiales bacterium]